MRQPSCAWLQPRYASRLACRAAPSPVSELSAGIKVQEDMDDDAHLIERLGLSYDPDRIEAYFAERPDELKEHTYSAAWTLAGLALPTIGATAMTWAGLKYGKKPKDRKEEEKAWSSLRKEIAPRVAKALSDLGPTYVKFGQALASRPDLVTAEIAAGLVQLQDALPPFSPAVAQQILVQELSGRGPEAEELLASLKGAEPVAAASLGQVYKGRVGGRDVAVKVQRPEVRRSAAADAALLKAAAKAITALRMPVQKPGARALDGQLILTPLVRADVVGAVDEFCSRLFEELDYTKEAANIQHFAALYGKDGEHAAKLPSPGVRVPELIPKLCSRRVLVMEWIDGERLVPAEADGSSGHIVAPSDRPLLEVGIAATLMQLLEIGVMHTDPHGGNLLKAHHPPTSGSQLVYLDFGLIASVPLQVRDGLVCAVMYIIRQRWDRVAILFNQLMLLPDWVLENEEVLAQFTADVEAASELALDFENTGPDGVPSLHFSALLEQLALLAPRYEFRLPPYFLNNAKALGCLEGMARAADPDFNILRRMYPFALERLMKNPSASPVLQRTLRDLARDPKSGHLSRHMAMELVGIAASFQGAEKREVLKDLLRTPTGRKFALEVLAGDSLAVLDKALTRTFDFVDRVAFRVRQRFDEKWRPLHYKEWQDEED